MRTTISNTREIIHTIGDLIIVESPWNYVKPVYKIAIDFDGCLALNSWPYTDKAVLNRKVVALMRQRQRQYSNVVFILWTCRVGSKLEEAKQFVETHKLPIYLFNENHPSTYAIYGTECRKIDANEYWDDKAYRVGPSRLKTLWETIKTIGGW